MRSITDEPWFKNGLADYKATELAVKRFWRAARKARKREEWIRQYGLEAVARAVQ